MIVAAIIAVSVLAPHGGNGGGAGSGSGPAATNAAGAAHQCWKAPDGSIAGCRLANGSVEGTSTGTPVTCFFDEPLPATETTLSCSR